MQTMVGAGGLSNVMHQNWQQMPQQIATGRPKSAIQQIYAPRAIQLHNNFSSSPQPDRVQYAQYSPAVQSQYIGHEYQSGNNIMTQGLFGRQQSPQYQLPHEQSTFYSPPQMIVGQHQHSPLITNPVSLFQQTMPVKFESINIQQVTKPPGIADRLPRLEALPSFRNLKNKKATQRAHSQGVEASQDNFGTKSLKSILNNIEMVEETDKHKKEKTKRRFQPPPRQKHIVLNDKTTEKKPPTHMNFGNIKTLNVESLEEAEDSEYDNAETIVYHRPPVANINVSQQKQQREFQIKLQSLQSSRKRVKDALTNRGRNHMQAQESVQESSKTPHESYQFMRKLADILAANLKSRLIREIVKVSSSMRISFVENQRRHFSSEVNREPPKVEQHESQYLPADLDEDDIQDVSFVSKDLQGVPTSTRHHSTSRNRNQPAHENGDTQIIESQDYEISMSPQRPNRPPTQRLNLPVWSHVEMEEQVHHQPQYTQVPLYAESLQRFFKSTQQESDKNLRLPQLRNYIKRLPPKLKRPKPIKQAVENQEIMIPVIELPPYEEDVKFRDCGFPKQYSASQIINHEQLGITFIKISINQIDTDVVFTVDIEVKQRNQNFGPLLLSRTDIKQCFKDVILIGSAQKGNSKLKDHLMIEKIGRLLVSDTEIVHKYMTRDILLKISKVLLSHSIIIKKRITGKKFCLQLSNQQLKQSLLPKDDRVNKNYLEQLVDLKLLSVQWVKTDSERRTKIISDSLHHLINKTVRINGIFAVTSVSYHRLINKWVLTIYIQSSQKTLKSYFSFKQLKKVHSLLSKKKEDISRLGMSGIEYLDQTLFNNSSIKKKQNEGRYGQKQPLKVTEKSLKLFNQKTSSFQDKEITEEFSINKTLQFLQNNGNFFDKVNTSQTNLTNNLRFIDRERKISDFQNTESLASERNESEREKDFQTPEQQKVQIRMGKSSSKHKKQEQKKNNPRQRKELMFNNDYLNCYFKIHEDTQKRLEQTQLDWVESVKSKDENDELMGIDEDNLAFNRQQMLPFWKRLLASLSFSDTFGGDEEDGERAFKLMLRITKDGKCFNKKLHLIIFEDEIEQFTDQPSSFNLLWKTVSLDPLSQAFENPYGGGASTLSMIKMSMNVIDPDEYMLNIKTFNIQSGKMSKQKKSIQSLLRDHQHNQRKKINIKDLYGLIHKSTYDQDYENQQRLLLSYTEKDNYQYQPTENRLVSDIIFNVSEQAVTKHKKVAAKEVLKARDEFIKMKRLQKHDFTAHFTKIHTLEITEARGKKTIPVEVQLQLTSKSVIVRLYNPELFFKHDYTVYFQEITDKHQLGKGILTKANSGKDPKFKFSILSRISELVLPKILQEYSQRYFQQIPDEFKSEKKVKQIPKVISENPPEPTKLLKVALQTSEPPNLKLAQSASKNQLGGLLKVSSSNVFQKIKQGKLDNLKSIEVSTLTAGAIANNVSGFGNFNPMLNQSRDNSLLSNTMLSKNMNKIAPFSQTKSQPQLVPQTTGKFGDIPAAAQNVFPQWPQQTTQVHTGIIIPHLQKQQQQSQPAIQIRQAGLTPDQSRVESVVTLGGFKFFGKKKKKKKKRQLLRKDMIDFRKQDQQDESDEREEEEE